MVTVVGLTAFFALLDVGIFVLGSVSTGPLGPAAGMVLRVALDLSLLAVVRHPRTVTVLMIVGCLMLQVSELVSPGLLVTSPVLTGDPLTLAPIGPVVYVLVQRNHRASTWALVVVVTLLATRPWAPSWATIPLGLLVTAVPALLARYFTARADLLAELRERAARAEEEGRAHERARLAAEMHDVVSHRVSLMVLQAGALEVTASDPATRQTAEALREAGMQALDELRGLVGVFGAERDGASPAVGPPAPHADLAELVDASAAAGVAVRLVTGGADERVPDAVARTAHRVVQEALTNVHKHAPGGEVSVDVRYGPDAVTVAVVNSAPTVVADPALAASGSGRGLRGLRERVELLGGVLRAGPRPDGGFGVHAELPGGAP